MSTRTPSPRHAAAGPARAARRLGRHGDLRPALAALAPLAWAASLAGCLSVPDGPAPMCQSTSDCDQAHGEVCDEGVCWGNPPPGPFAAVISPPSTRRDLVPRELPQVDIPPDGWMGDLALDAPVLLKGRIVAFCPPPMSGCDSKTLGATVTVSRRSQFHGGPGFKAVVNVESGADSFAIPVPRTRVGDDPYTVTIVPAGGLQAGTDPSPAEQVPPLRMQVSITATAATNGVIELGGLDLPVVSGTLSNGLGLGLTGYRVAALGRWDSAAAPTEVSSVDFTGTTGAYAVTLSDELVGTVELVARPADGSIGPTVHLANIDATKSSQHNIVAPTSLGNPIKVVIGPVTGVDRSGAISPVRGALVSATGALTNTVTSFTISDEHLTDENGKVTLNLLDGAGITGSYRLSILPPASSPLGAVLDQKLMPGTEVRLASRVALRGTVFDADGKPLNNVAVTARPSLRFLWTLEAAPQAFVAAIPAATAVTLPTGEFVVWVDPNIAKVWGNYDLLIEPPSAAQAPTYIKTDIDIRRDGTPGSDGTLDSVPLGKISLPDAAFVHGRITGPGGDVVENAEIKLYLVSTELSLCSEVAHAPASCPIPAQLQGRNTSDAKGAVRLMLPR
jgi:hypothetical protein